MLTTAELTPYVVTCGRCYEGLFLRHVRMVPAEDGTLVPLLDDIHRVMLIHARIGCTR